MKSSFILVSFIYSSLSYAQTDREILSIFKSERILKSFGPSSIYTVSCDSFDVKKVIEVLPLFYRRTKPDTLRLSKSEENYLIASLLDTGAAWIRKIVPKATYVPPDSISKIFYNLGGWDYFHKHYGDGFYTLVKPVFLRDNSICFLFFEYSCGGVCGLDHLTVYKKKNDIWEYYSTVYSVIR